MRKFRISYTGSVNGDVFYRTKCVIACNGHEAKAIVSRNLFERGILHPIKTDFFIFPGDYFKDQSTPAPFQVGTTKKPTAKFAF